MDAALPAPVVIAKRPPVNKWLVTISVSFGTLMGAVDTSIVNVALPQIRGSVGATIQEITWISTGYAIALVLVMPFTAFLGRMFGQKRVYLVCLALFLAGSFLCGVATSLPALICFRAIQGFGAGALQPTEQAILRQTFPPQEQGMAMAVFAMAVMLGPAIGPTLGGYIVDNYHWSWIFFINLPVGAVGLFMVLSFVHEDEEILAANQVLAAEQRKHIDWAGIALLCVGVSALQYFLEEGARDDWFDSRLISACFLIAVFAIAAFVIRELRAPVPAVDLRLFKDTVFLSGTLIGAMMFAMLMANMFLLPIFMQELLGFTATQSGLALMPRVLVMMAAVPIVGRLYNHVDPRIIVATGIFFFCVGAYEMSSLTLESGVPDVIGVVAIQGIGFACLFVPLTTAALTNIPRHRMADATGLNSLLRQIGGAAGLAVFATVLDTYGKEATASVRTHLDPTRPEVWARMQSVEHGLRATGLDATSAEYGSHAVLDGIARQQGMVLAFDRIFLLAGIAFLFVLPVLYFLKVNRQPGQPAAKAHLEH
ncbi:MAG: DHA2 family efflux MFS transporter permease subunit [Polyangiales bacterium]|nr:DHA2 family efflux MFS transporter permease subunit [Myxococcales bacterium]